MRRVTVSVGLVLMMGACGQPPSTSSGFEVLPLEGSVEIFQDGVWKAVSERTPASRGHEVRAGSDGKARIYLPDQQTVELAPEARVRLARPDAAEVLQGSVLAQARVGLGVGVGDVEVTAANAVFRVDLGLSQRVAVYRGEARVPESGWEEPVRAFQQLGLVGGSAPRPPVPLQVDTQDAWDIRMLGEAMDVGLALLQKETGLASQLRSDGSRRAVIDALSRSLPAQTLASLLADRPPALVVVAATVAMAVESEVPTRVLHQILNQRALGASWIVVAGLWDVSRSVLDRLADIVTLIVLRAVPQAASGSPLSPSLGIDATGISELIPGTSGGSGGSGGGGSGSRGGGGDPSPPAGGGGGGGGGAPPGGGGGGGPSPGPSPSPSPPPSPTPSPSVSPSPTCSDAVACAVQDVIGDVPRTSPSPTPSP